MNGDGCGLTMYDWKGCQKHPSAKTEEVERRIAFDRFCMRSLGV